MEENGGVPMTRNPMRGQSPPPSSSSSSTSSKSTQTPIPVGARVVLRGLEDEPELNGQRGVVHAQISEERYGVWLDDGRGPFSLKADKLTAVGDEKAEHEESCNAAAAAARAEANRAVKAAAAAMEAATAAQVDAAECSAAAAAAKEEAAARQVAGLEEQQRNETKRNETGESKAERERVKSLIEHSKEKLLPWARLSDAERTTAANEALFGQIGGCEGVPVLLMICSLDEDGNGTLDDAEFKEFEEKGASIVEKTLYLGNTVALVTALLLSMLLGLMVPAATGDAPEASGDSEDFLGKKGCRVVMLLYYIALTLTITASIVGLFTSVIVINTLGSWLSAVSDKLEWVVDNVKCLMVQSVAMQTSMVCLCLTMLFGALLTSPLLGLMSCSPIVAVLGVFYILHLPNIEMTKKKLHDRAKIAFRKVLSSEVKSKATAASGGGSASKAPPPSSSSSSSTSPNI